LGDYLSDEMREGFTRAKLCDPYLIALVGDYEIKSGSLFVRGTENLRHLNIE
jgi:hypothetical protein